MKGLAWLTPRHATPRDGDRRPLTLLCLMLPLQGTDVQTGGSAHGGNKMTNEKEQLVPLDHHAASEAPRVESGEANATGSRANIATWLGIAGLTIIIIGGISKTLWPSNEGPVDSRATSSTDAVPGTMLPAGAIDNSRPAGEPSQMAPTDRSENAHPSDRSRTPN
jgi:hypothetical protein